MVTHDLLCMQKTKMAANLENCYCGRRLFCSLLLVLLLLVSSVYQEDVGVSSPQFYQPRSVYEYKEYRNVQLFHFKIPSQVTEAMWQFLGFLKGDDSCPYLDIQIALQWGSYPVIDPTNSSFPDNTLLKRTSLLEFHTVSNMMPLYLRMSSPLEGDWFAAVYLPPPTDPDKIQPKGFGENCNYFLGSILQYHKEIDITTLIADTDSPQNIDYGDYSVLLKFFVADNIGAVTFKLEGCQYKTPTLQVTDACAVQMASRADALPAENSNWLDCMKDPQQNGTCSLTVQQPKRSKWYYLRVNRAIQNASIGFSAKVKVEDCGNQGHSYLYLDPDIENADLTKLNKHKVGMTDQPETDDPADEMTMLYPRGDDETSASHYYDEVFTYRMYIEDTDDKFQSIPNIFDLDLEDDDTCLPDAPMQRDKYAADFTILYSHTDELFNTSVNVVNIEPDKASILSFETRPIVEIGGHIRITAHLLQQSNSTENVSVHICLRNGAPPIFEDNELICDEEMSTTINSSDDYKILHMPYPEPGIWYIALSTQCYTNVSGQVVLSPCKEITEVSLKVQMEPCMLGCNGQGTCRRYYSGELLFATCVCSNNYLGWACTNDTYALSEDFLRLQMLLLSLSNLFFLPAVILAAYRMMFVESLVYFYTMFFSGFYHVCDSGGFCMMDYDTMQFCDFLASVLAVWVTLVAMAVLKPQYTSFLHMFGTLVLITITKYDRFSIWIFVIPVLAGLVLIIGSWIYKCRITRSCYPGIRHVIAHFIPGVFIAGTALILYTFVENSTNYYYVHSLWHVLIATSIVFLLPPKQEKSKKHLQRTPSSEDILSENDHDIDDEPRDLPHPI
ncbi:post-GPI attachment to proteins factor 6-like isoform X1 [Ptychodera flava]|uniref:post-GPI attachment to proteins factor 6-like isoform X1 n=1 Tax=Ptychodera flava TaxID=63121 RepID=UPI00396A75E0